MVEFATPEVTALAELEKGEVLAATFGGGIAQSSDDGRTWKSYGTGLGEAEERNLVALKGGRVFAGAQRGLFRSDDAGRTWKRVEEPLGNDNVQTLGASGEGNVCAGTWRNGLYGSTDRGKTWAYVDIRAPPPSVASTSNSPKGPLYVGLRSGEVFQLQPEAPRRVTWGKMDDSAVRHLVVTSKGQLVGGTARKLYWFDEAKRTLGPGRLVFAAGSGSDKSRLHFFDGSSIRAGAEIDGKPSCLAILPEGGIAMTVGSDVLALPLRAAKPKKRSDDRPGCRELIARKDGSLVMLDEVGIHRSADGARTWTRVDRLKRSEGTEDGGN